MEVIVETIDVHKDSMRTWLCQFLEVSVDDVPTPEAHPRKPKKKTPTNVNCTYSYNCSVIICLNLMHYGTKNCMQDNTHYHTMKPVVKWFCD